MAMTPHEERAADRRALLQAAATLYAGGNGLMDARSAVEIAMQLEVVILESTDPIYGQRDRAA